MMIQRGFLFLLTGLFSACVDDSNPSDESDAGDTALDDTPFQTDPNKDCVANNLLSGPEMRIETDTKFQNFGNISRILTDAFQDVSQGNLHLNRKIPEIVDSAAPVPQVASDFDRRPRDAKPDIGADEWQDEERVKRKDR